MCFLAASGFAIAGIAGAGSAGADNPPGPPNYQFSTAATAIGVQVALQRNPDFSNLPDPFDIELPDSEAQLNSFGTSQADGHLANLNGLGGIPGLICLAAGAATCAQIPIGQLTGGLIPSFPPPDPVDAHATYPAAQTAKAPLVGTKQAQLSVDTSGFNLGAGHAEAEAHQYDTMTNAAAQNLGIANAVSIGSVTTHTTQAATADGVTTTATATVSGINIGGKLLSIGSMTTTTTVVSVPGKPGTDTTSTVLGDVKVAGLPATIDSSGVHIQKSNLPTNVVAAVQKLLNQAFGKAGIKVTLAQITRTNDSQGHTVAASGLKITFDRNVTGTQPITISPPKGIPCPPALQNLPLDPCSGVSFTIDGSYHGVIELGQVGVVSLAQPGNGVPTIQPTTPGGSTPPTSGPGGQGVVPGGPTVPPGGPTVTSSTPPSGPGPVIAPGGQAQVADQLKDVSHRLEWFFPLLAFGLFALIGRFRTPSRLPGAGTNPRA
jgi:hypothetical protein